MMTDETMEVKIFMNDGQTKFGILLNGLSAIENTIDTFKFICNSQVQKYKTTANSNLIELLSFNEVKVVETYLR